MNVLQRGGAPIKCWTDGVEVEREAAEQLYNVASLPFIYKHVAVMPDVHWGIGATVGSVIPTKGAIVPAAVGVDIGCGMVATMTQATAKDLPDNLRPLRDAIENAIPVGRTHNGGVQDKGAWRDDTIPTVVRNFWRSLSPGYNEITQTHRKLRQTADRVVRQLGTLGTGNHFIEVCLDEADRVWVMLHSGSRGVGNAIGTHFIEQAQREAERWHIPLPDRNLAFLPEGSPLFDQYVQAMTWAQDYAAYNRQLMLDLALDALQEVVLGLGEPIEQAINCHHNYCDRENHGGQNVWVTRKGAVRARAGDLGIIPGSMGAKSYIVRGKGNPESFHSCSHGAGRRMSRSEARRRFTVEDHEAATQHVECRKDEGVIDETPGAYKDIDAVMAAQADLVEVVHALRQVVCVKG